MTYPSFTIHLRYTSCRDGDHWLAYRHDGAWSARGRTPEEAIGRLMLEMSDLDQPPAVVRFHNPRPIEEPVLAGKGGAR